MKKATIIVQSKDSDSTVEKLRSLGLLHVEHQETPQGKDISAIKDEIVLIKEASAVLSKTEFRDDSIRKENKEVADWKLTAKHIIDCGKRYEQLQEYSQRITNNIAEWQQWGDFDPQTIRSLSEKNIYIRLYQVPLREIKSFPSEAIVKVISRARGIARCVAISQKKIDIPFKEINLPAMGLEEMRARFKEDKKVMDSIAKGIKRHNCYYENLAQVNKSLEKDLEFEEALNGMGKFESLMYIKGYIPFDVAGSLTQAAKKEKWGIIISDPSAEDNVPTLIRNPRWISLVSPIFKFLDILPGYREFDISLLFLIFFSIFFGILIGDAGYGLVYCLLTFFIQRKTKKKDPAFFLFYILSLCAVIWGFLTGTFFGQEWFLKAGYKPLLPILNDAEALQRLFFFIGALHLSIAHFWRGIRKAPSINAMGDLGWICVLWAVFFIAKTLILGDAFPSFCKWLFIFGAASVILFTNPQKNILKFGEEWASWLITLPFGFIGNFADVVSYIRLFAVGLAGVAIADAFNAMAAMIGQGNSIFMIVSAAFVAFLGNVLGVVLGPVSVLVHGIRLNLLEFSSNHMGLSWSGVSYKPLK